MSMAVPTLAKLELDRILMASLHIARAKAVPLQTIVNLHKGSPWFAPITWVGLITFNA